MASTNGRAPGDKPSQLDRDKARLLRRRTQMAPYLDRVVAAEDSLVREGLLPKPGARPATAGITPSGAVNPLGGYSVIPRSSQYRRGGEHSIFRDALLGPQGNTAARRRLDIHERETRTGATGASPRLLAAQQAVGELRAINANVAGAGAEFSPPAWMIDDASLAPRAGRAFVDTWTRLPLPPGVSVIDVPRITTGSTVAVQVSQNSAPSSTDLVTSSVSAPVISLTGQEDMSMQLLEQGPSHDAIIWADLQADYDQKLSVQAINGSGSSGQALGVLNVTGITSTAFTTGSPTVLLAWPKLATALAAVHTSRFRSPTHVVLHGRRWSWFLDALDTNNRPFVNANRGPDEDASSAQAGRLFGLPVIVDDNIPTNLGAGTNQDVAAFVRAPDLYLYEGEPRLRVLTEVLGGTLTARIQLLTFVAIVAGRLPSAISIVTGTGLTPPTM